MNPLVYMSEGLRAALTPDVPHMHPAVVLLAMAAATAFFLDRSLRAFRRRVVS